MCIAGGRIDSLTQASFGRIEDVRPGQVKQIRAHEHIFYEGDERSSL